MNRPWNGGVDKCFVRKSAKELVLNAVTISAKEACSFARHLRSEGAGFLANVFVPQHD